jgi:ABC-type phosphate transport system substrate-binding protein
MVRTSRINSKMLMQQIILCSFINSNRCQNLCSRVQRFGQASGVVEAVGRISNSIGYSGISGVVQDLLINSTDDSCRIKLAAMQNRAGEIVQPSINSAQSAVRSRANALLFQSTCPGFGMCADVLDADDYDVWPITAMTVSLTAITADKPRSLLGLRHHSIALMVADPSTRSTSSSPSSAATGAAPPCGRR